MPTVPPHRDAGSLSSLSSETEVDSSAHNSSSQPSSQVVSDIPSHGLSDRLAPGETRLFCSEMVTAARRYQVGRVSGDWRDFVGRGYQSPDAGSILNP